MSTDFSEQIHPPFCLRSMDNMQRYSVFINDWTYSQTQELDDYLLSLPCPPWYISTDRDSIPDMMTATDVYNLVLDGRAAKEKKKESALEKKLKQYNKLKEELGL